LFYFFKDRKERKMKMNEKSLFHGLKQSIDIVANVNWVKMWYVMGIILAIWLGLATIIPANTYKYVSVVLSALQTGITFAMRGGKYVVNRTELPPKDL
jgi:hypothetical protein